MYRRYAESRGWSMEILDAAPNALGGFREVTARITGEEVFRFLKYESGVHRVQRVPATETFKIQEYHLPVYHMLCIAAEHEFFGD